MIRRYKCSSGAADDTLSVRVEKGDDLSFYVTSGGRKSEIVILSSRQVKDLRNLIAGHAESADLVTEWTDDTDD